MTSRRAQATIEDKMGGGEDGSKAGRGLDANWGPKTVLGMTETAVIIKTEDTETKRNKNREEQKVREVQAYIHEGRGEEERTRVQRMKSREARRRRWAERADCLA